MCLLLTLIISFHHLQFLQQPRGGSGAKVEIDLPVGAVTSEVGIGYFSPLSGLTPLSPVLLISMYRSMLIVCMSKMLPGLVNMFCT